MQEHKMEYIVDPDWKHILSIYPKTNEVRVSPAFEKLSISCQEFIYFQMKFFVAGKERINHHTEAMLEADLQAWNYLREKYMHQPASFWRKLFGEILQVLSKSLTDMNISRLSQLKDYCDNTSNSKETPDETPPVQHI